MLITKIISRYNSKRFKFTLIGWASLWINIALGSVFDKAMAAVTIELEPIASNLSLPVDINHAGDGTNRLFIVLKGGQIRIFDGSTVLAMPFLDISSLVSSGGEQGLLGVAFHPQYAVNGFFYVHYTDTNGSTVIARYQVSADANRADPGSAQVLLTIPQPFGNHNGGQLHFGPDSYLYIAVGDGGSGGDPFNNAQDLATLLGKILRIDVNGAMPYSVPPDNPFIGDLTAQPEIWALGLRNPWRFSFDQVTGDMFVADVGQAEREEVSFQPSDSMGGENYGWRLMEGTLCFIPASNCNDGTLTLPILEYSHSTGCSVTGGYRYRGVQYPGLEGIYFYADFCTGRVWGAQRDGSDTWTTDELLDTNLLISTFGEDEDGEIYLAHYASPNGAIYKVVTEVPGTPQDFKVVAVSAEQNDLSWTDIASDEDGFRLERKTGNQANFSQIATLAPDTVAFSDDGFPEGTTNQYRILAFNSKGDSAYSVTASADPFFNAPLSSTAINGGGDGGGGGGGGGCFISSAAE